jgi:GTP cyclohydrolase II
MRSCALSIAALLVAANCCFGEDIKPSPSTARPSMPYSGTATMQEDGSLTLHLQHGRDGKEINDTLTYKTSDRGYDSVLRHLGGLAPGDTKNFTPWRD